MIGNAEEDKQGKQKEEKEGGTTYVGSGYEETKMKMVKLFEKEKEKGKSTMILRELQPSDMIVGCLMCGAVHVWRKREWKLQLALLFDESFSYLVPPSHNLYFYQELEDGDLHR